MQYRADIDGLRAVAVLLVVLYHLKLGFSGGYVGVDVFFVISGYLICQLLLRSMDKGNFSWAHFWERRIRRLLPALSGVLLATAGLGWLLFFPEDLQALGHNLMAQPLMLSNLELWSSGLGYFGVVNQYRPTLQTWSLAVEEQFYLFFPLFLALLWRRGWLKAGTALTLAASLGLCLQLTPKNPTFAYLLLPTRAWELLLGVALAQLRPDGQRPGREGLAWLGLGAILASGWFLKDQLNFPGALALIPCLGTALVLITGPHTRLARLLSHPVPVSIGLISYSLFLWHWPLIAYACYLQPNTPELPVWLRWLVLALSLGLGFLSWKWVETPFRNQEWLTRRQVFLLAGLSGLFYLCLGSWLWAGQGFPARWPEPILALQQLKGKELNVVEVDVDKAVRGELAPLGSAAGPLRFMLWGDSHAHSIQILLDELARQRGVRGLGAVLSATPPFLDSDFIHYPLTVRGDEFRRRSRAIVDTVSRERIPHVLVVACWARYLNPELPANYTATIRSLQAAGAKVWVLRQIPLQSSLRPARALAMQRYWGWSEPIGVPFATHQKLQKGFQWMTEATPSGAELLDPAALMREGDFIPACNQQESYYFDETHLTLAGARRLAPLFQPLLD